MIQIFKDALDLDKFYNLLKLKQQSIVKDYINACVKRGSHESSTFKLVNTDKELGISQIYHKYGQMNEHIVAGFSEYNHSISFSLDGRLANFAMTSDSLTIADLIRYDVLDESKAVYVMSRDFMKDEYSIQHMLLGVYSTFEKMQEQIDQIRDDQLIPLDSIEVTVVQIDRMQNIELTSFY